MLRSKQTSSYTYLMRANLLGGSVFSLGLHYRNLNEISYCYEARGPNTALEGKPLKLPMESEKAGEGEGRMRMKFQRTLESWRNETNERHTISYILAVPGLCRGQRIL